MKPAVKPRRTRLGWLGPAIVILGLVVGTVGVWWMVHARPSAGAVIDRIAVDGEWSVVVRHEASSERSMIELTSSKTGALWQALIPPYAGRPGMPGVATAKNAVSVRVNRSRPELWVLSTHDAAKLGAIGLDGYAPGGWDPAGSSTVLTAGDGTRSYEVVDGKTGTAVVAIDLERGAVLWHREVPGPVRAVSVQADGSISVATAERSYVLGPGVAGPVTVP